MTSIWLQNEIITHYTKRMLRENLKLKQQFFKLQNRQSKQNLEIILGHYNIELNEDCKNDILGFLYIDENVII